jgi:hypothetical protein
MLFDALGWTATGIFSSSYFFKQPAALRKIQAGASLLWVVYGLAIGSAPVVAANLIVGVAAVCTSFRAAWDKEPMGTGLVHEHKNKEDSAVRKLSRMLDRLSRLSYVPATVKEGPSVYMLPICTIVWCGTLPVARTSDVQESVGVTVSKAGAKAAEVLNKGAAQCS